MGIFVHQRVEKAKSHETVMGIENGPSSTRTSPRLLTGVDG